MDMLSLQKDWVVSASWRLRIEERMRFPPTASIHINALVCSDVNTSESHAHLVLMGQDLYLLYFAGLLQPQQDLLWVPAEPAGSTQVQVRDCWPVQNGG